MTKDAIEHLKKITSAKNHERDGLIEEARRYVEALESKPWKRAISKPSQTKLG